MPPAQAPTVHVCGLFDLDGSLLDSETHKDAAHHQAIRELGGSLPHNFQRPIGHSLETSCRAAITAARIDVTYNRYRELYLSLYKRQREQGLELVPGALQLLQSCRDRRVRMGLVTASHGPDMREAIAQTLIWHYFAALVCADDVKRTKPHPEPYLLAMRKLGVEPKHCFALEDTESGVLSASGAGIRVCALRHARNQDHDFSRAFAVFDSLEDTERVTRTLFAAAGR